MRQYYSDTRLEKLFPCLGEEGQDVYPSEEATALAREQLEVADDALLVWHLPNIFDVRYGSSYVGTVRCGGKELQFHSLDGNFRDEDIKFY